LALDVCPLLLLLFGTALFFLYHPFAQTYSRFISSPNLTPDLQELQRHFLLLHFHFPEFLEVTNSFFISGSHTTSGLILLMLVLIVRMILRHQSSRAISCLNLPDGQSKCVKITSSFDFGLRGHHGNPNHPTIPPLSEKRPRTNSPAWPAASRPTKLIGPTLLENSRSAIFSATSPSPNATCGPKTSRACHPAIHRTAKNSPPPSKKSRAHGTLHTESVEIFSRLTDADLQKNVSLRATPPSPPGNGYAS